MKPLSLIVAVSENGVIGRDGDLPWHLPEDLKHFRRLTTGHAIIMGRKTYDSIGKPLPKRRMIVISRNTDLEIEGCEVVHSLDEAIGLAGDDPEPFIIGGATIYEEALARVTRIYLTRVHRQVEGDARFPELGSQWSQTERREGDGATFLTLER